VNTIGPQSQPPIRIGVIGATPARGWGTAAHLPALQALEEFEVTAVSTTRLSTARATAEVFGVPLAFDDDDELVSHPEVDAVAITVKVPEHDRLIRAALAAGKHVFSEWPLGVDLGQASALAELARASGVRHLVGLQGYQAPGALFVREMIENGDLGRLLTVSVVAAGGPAGRRIPQANVYATDVAAGATVLSISTGHILATLARAVGEFRELSAVVALVNTETTVIETGQTVPVTAPDQVVLAGRLEGGAVASVAVQGGSAPGPPWWSGRPCRAASTSPTGPSPSASPTARPRTCRCPGACVPYPRRCRPGRRETSPSCTASSPGRSATASRPRRTSRWPSGTTSCLSRSSGRRTLASGRTPAARLKGHERPWRTAHRRMR
jgi:predicted dehydrogenase